MGKRYTPELLAEAAGATDNLDDAVRWCGGRPTPASRRYLRRKMAEAGVESSHFPDRWARHTEPVLREAVAESSCIKEVLARLGIDAVGGNHAHISRRIARFGIDTSHFAVRVRRRQPAVSNPLSLRSRAAGRVPGSRLRSALINRGVPEKCEHCGCGPRWLGRPLRLEVDHINGEWWDNRPHNLRLLCPNCHAATDTYRGRKRERSL